jgi:hypothetical protein
VVGALGVADQVVAVDVVAVGCRAKEVEHARLSMGAGGRVGVFAGVGRAQGVVQVVQQRTVAHAVVGLRWAEVQWQKEGSARSPSSRMNMHRS